MGEVKTELKAYRVDRACDIPNCDGRMMAGSGALLSFPPKYPHTCTKCGVQQAFIIPYPYTNFEPID